MSESAAIVAAQRFLDANPQYPGRVIGVHKGDATGEVVVAVENGNYRSTALIAHLLLSILDED